MRTTFVIWEVIKKKDKAGKINAAIKKSYKPKISIKATEETVTLLDKIDLANPPKSLNNYIINMLKARLDKYKAAEKEAKRRNCSVGTKPKIEKRCIGSRF